MSQRTASRGESGERHERDGIDEKANRPGIDRRHGSAEQVDARRDDEQGPAGAMKAPQIERQEHDDRQRREEPVPQRRRRQNEIREIEGEVREPRVLRPTQPAVLADCFSRHDLRSRRFEAIRRSGARSALRGVAPPPRQPRRHAEHHRRDEQHHHVLPYGRRTGCADRSRRELRDVILRHHRSDGLEQLAAASRRASTARRRTPAAG